MIVITAIQLSCYSICLPKAVSDVRGVDGYGNARYCVVLVSSTIGDEFIVPNTTFGNFKNALEGRVQKYLLPK